MDPVTALIFAAIATHYIMKAAAQAGLTQTRAELGRARDAIRSDLAGRRDAASARLRERLETGRRFGPRSGWWWAWAALRARSALRNIARRPRRPAESRPGRNRATTGPIGRILGAAWRGAVYAWEDARRWQEAWREGEENRRRPTAGPDVGVCERCGAVVATAALAEGTTRHGRTARMCAGCRALCEKERQADAADAAARPSRAAPGDVAEGAFSDDGGRAADSSRPAAPAAQTSGAEREEDDIAALREAQERIRRRAAEARRAPGWEGRCGEPSAVSCVRCGSVVAAACCTNAACPLSWRNAAIPAEGWPEPVPDRFALPPRTCPECSTQLLPGTWHAVNATNADVCLFCARDNHPEGTTRERQPVELAALGNPVDADGNPRPVHPGQHRMLGQEAARIATEAAAGPHGPCSLCGCPLGPDLRCAHCDGPPQATPPEPDAPAGPQALPPAPTPEGDDVSCEVHTQAAWQMAADNVHETLGGITDSVENMLRSLSAKNAGRGHIAAAKHWGDQVAAVTARGKVIVGQVNDHQDPYVDAVQGAGGSEEVADPDFYDEM